MHSTPTSSKGGACATPPHLSSRRGKKRHRERATAINALSTRHKPAQASAMISMAGMAKQKPLALISDRHFLFLYPLRVP
ncbi:hypothetical protein BDV96DRAFT_330754 [Lophiotrema nucula]|uniref:Uncharacterized protein n=1 Tax=Lophiotrema nucula TaxID=690887 RepID=A0A6A5YK44_9PLEO|nr:hypothetical protein BDV96DRAFT_330754 [Lophiotrema nucula]